MSSINFKTIKGNIIRHKQGQHRAIYCGLASKIESKRKATVLEIGETQSRIDILLMQRGCSQTLEAEQCLAARTVLGGTNSAWRHEQLAVGNHHGCGASIGTIKQATKHLVDLILQRGGRTEVASHNASWWPGRRVCNQPLGSRGHK